MLDAGADDGIGVSVISCWEAAKLVEYGRLTLPQDIAEWVGVALDYPGVRLIELTPATPLNLRACHNPSIKDPADQMLVATARVLDCPLQPRTKKS